MADVIQGRTIGQLPNLEASDVDRLNDLIAIWRAGQPNGNRTGAITPAELQALVSEGLLDKDEADLLYAPLGAVSGGLAIATITTSQTVLPGYLYYVDTPSLVSLLLPANPANGDSWGFINNSGGTVRVTQNTGDQIVVGDLQTTPGITGRITSVVQGDWVEFRRVSNKWRGYVKSGYIEVV